MIGSKKYKEVLEKMKPVKIGKGKYLHDPETGKIYSRNKHFHEISLFHFTAQEFIQLREQVRN